MSRFSPFLTVLVVLILGCKPSTNSASTANTVSKATDRTTAKVASTSESAMTPARLHELIQRIDPEAKLSGNTSEFTVAEQSMVMVFDDQADRMRLVIPIMSADNISPEQMLRLMQANFDSALDARYAIGQGLLWATFIHPLSSLSDQQFLQGVGQTINIAESHGSSYSSGVFVFGGGDSNEIQRRALIDELEKLGNDQSI